MQPGHLLIGVLGAQLGTVLRTLAIAGVDQHNLTVTRPDHHRRKHSLAAQRARFIAPI